MEDSGDRFLPLIRSVWRRCIGQAEDHPMTQYIVESVAIDLASNGIPDSLDSCLNRFEETVSSSDAVDPDDSREFCEALLLALQQFTAEDIDEESLQPGECEMCERFMPLTKHHLIPRMMHNRMRKHGYDRALLNQTADICRPCHNAVHRCYTEKELAMEFNTIEKLMQV